MGAACSRRLTQWHPQMAVAAGSDQEQFNTARSVCTGGQKGGKGGTPMGRRGPFSVPFVKWLQFRKTAVQFAFRHPRAMSIRTHLPGRAAVCFEELDWDGLGCAGIGLVGLGWAGLGWIVSDLAGVSLE